MATEKSSKRNIWLIPTLLVLLAIGGLLGYRAWEERRADAEQEYQRELAVFGVVEMGAPVMNATHFARHGEVVVDDMEALLASPDANDLARTQAMEVLVLVQGSDAAPTLIEQVEQRGSPVRERAIALLGRTESERAAEYLASLTERPQLAEPALMALANMPREAEVHRDRIVRLLDSEQRGIARQAALTLGSIGGDAARQALLPRLEREDLAQPAARGLARMQDERGIQFLLAVIQGERPGDREAAEAGLSEAGEAAEPPVSALLAVDDRETVVSALRILRHIGQPENHPQWIPFIRSDDPEVRLAVLHLLDARTAPPAAREVFRLLATDRENLSDEEIPVAERVLRQASRQDFQFYAEQLQTGEPPAQILAIRTVAFSQDQRAVDLLMSGLSHESPIVRRESAASLGRMQGVGALGGHRERVYQRISEMAEDDPDQQVRQTARSLLIVLRP